MKSAVAIILLVILGLIHGSKGSIQCYYCNVDGQQHDDNYCGGIDNFQTLSDLIRCSDTSLDSIVKLKFEHNNEIKVFAEGCFCQHDSNGTNS